MKIIETSLKFNIPNKTTVTYELSSAGVVRRTDVTIESIVVYGNDINKIYLHLPKDANTFSHDVLYGYVTLTNIGGAYAQVPVKTRSNGCAISADSGALMLDINNHLYIVFPLYNLTTIS